MQAAQAKPRYRIGTDGTNARPIGDVAPVRANAGNYLRDTRSAVIQTRMAPLTESRDNIRRAWRRVAGLAQDLIMNSGRLSGVMQQIISDTIGTELQLNPKPDEAVLRKLGMDDAEIREFKESVKREWKYYSWSPAECDWRGKLTVSQMCAVALRQYFIYGEVTGIHRHMMAADRARYGLSTGTKMMMVAPARLVQDTNEMEGLFQGVYHDHNGRVHQYLFSSRDAGFEKKTPYPARNGLGLPGVTHVFDPVGADDVRGISPLAGGFRKHIQHEMLEDVTLQMGVLKTSLGIALTSEAPSPEAFEALSELASDKNDLGKVAQNYIELFDAQIANSAEGRIEFGPDPRISKLAPGEKLDLKTVSMPGPDYEPFNASLSRDMARALGVTYSSLTMDSRNITYTSGRTDTAVIWPVVQRRREHIVSPLPQAIYENWLDEAIFLGVVPFRPGIAAYRANRDKLNWTQWRGPAKPTPDDQKSAKASTERMQNMTSSQEFEAAELGHDADELREQQYEEHQWYVGRGMRSPYDRPNTPAAHETDDEDDRESDEAGAA